MMLPSATPTLARPFMRPTCNLREVRRQIPPDCKNDRASVKGSQRSHVLHRPTRAVRGLPLRPQASGRGTPALETTLPREEIEAVTTRGRRNAPLLTHGRQCADQATKRIPLAGQDTCWVSARGAPGQVSLFCKRPALEVSAQNVLTTVGGWLTYNRSAELRACRLELCNPWGPVGRQGGSRRYRCHGRAHA